MNLNAAIARLEERLLSDYCQCPEAEWQILEHHPGSPEPEPDGRLCAICDRPIGTIIVRFLKVEPGDRIS